MSRSVALVAPARYLDPDILDKAVARCRSNGIDAYITPGCALRSHQFAGTDEERAEAFIEEWNEGSADTLWCVRGGYGSGRLLPLIPGRLRANGKTLIGYSDQTCLLAHISRNGLGRAVHGPMPIDIDNDQKLPSFDRLLASLQADDFRVHFEPVQVLRQGSAEGRTIVGSLSLLTRLIGTPTEPEWDGAILVPEDVDEHFYSIDRMFLHLRQAGALDRIAGLALGEFTGTQDNAIPFGRTVEQIALDHLGDRDIPVLAGLPLGHGANNMPMVYGAMATIDQRGLIVIDGRVR